MYKFRYVRGSKVVTYQQYEVPFRKGITTIRGGNRSGKSLSMSVMGNIFFSAPPISTAKNSAKHLHVHSGSTMAVGFERGKEMVHIEQISKGKGVGYNIFVHPVGDELNRKEHNIKARGDVKAQIRRLFRQNDDLFYNSCYISGLRRNVLQEGRAADRYAFFQRTFNLTVFDKIRKVLDKKLKKLQRDEATLIYLRGERDRLPETIDLSHTKSELKKAQRVYNKLNEKVSQAQATVTELTAVTTLLGQLSDKTLTKDKVDEALQTHGSAVGTLEKEHKALVRQQADADAAEESREKREKIKGNLAKLDKVKGTVDECNETILHLEEDIPTLEGHLDTLEETEGQRAEMEAMKDTLKKLWGKKERVPMLVGKQLEQEIDKARAKLASAKETLASFADLTGHKNCPTCQQALNNKMISGMLSKAKEDKAAYGKRLEMLSLMKEINSITLEPPPKLPKKFKNVSREGLAEMKERLGKEKKRLEYLHLKQRLEEQLTLLPEPPKTKDVSKKLSRIARDLKEARRQLEQAKADRKILDKLEDFDGDLKTAPSRLKKAKALLAKLGPRVGKANNRVQRLKLEKADLLSKKDQILHLDSEIAKLADAAEQIPIYQSLMKAYGPKGMRIDRIRSLAELYVERLNQYAPRVFAERFTFSVVIEPNRFDIIATRSGIPGDINLLSGSEVRCFQLLHFLAIMSMVPKPFRTNFVVLDELEANMDLASSELYAKEFLPKLKKLVDCIFVITPKTEKEFSIDGVDHRFVVTKTKGVSKLQEMAA